MPSNNFDEILSVANNAKKPQPEVKKEKGKGRSPHPWEHLEPEEREASIRLNLDIPMRLNDKLADEARRRRTSKAELVRLLLEWALEEEGE